MSTNGTCRVGERERVQSSRRRGVEEDFCRWSQLQSRFERLIPKAPGSAGGYLLRLPDHLVVLLSELPDRDMNDRKMHAAIKA